MVSSLPEVVDCKYESEFDLQLAIALAKSDVILNDQFKLFFKRCNPMFTERTLDILHYPYRKGHDLKDIIVFLKSRGFNKEELSNITSIWNSKYPQKKEIQNISSLVNLINSEKSKLTKFSLLNKLIKYGEKSDSIFIANLLKSVGYGQIGNRGLLVSNFRKLISINEISYISDLKQEYVSEKNKENYYKLLNDLFVLLRDALDDEKFIRILDSNFSFLDLSGKIIKYESTDLDWSLSEIREKMSSALYRQAFPAFWMKAIENRGSEAEQRKFSSRLENLRIIKSLDLLDFWIFKEKLPNNDKIREFILELLSNSYEDSIATDYVILNILEEPIYKKNISKINPKLRRPIFTLKRNLFHKALRDGRETSFPIMNLIEMGEEREDFIWWLIL